LPLFKGILVEPDGRQAALVCTQHIHFKIITTMQSDWVGSFKSVWIYWKNSRLAFIADILETVNLIQPMVDINTLSARRMFISSESAALVARARVQSPCR